MSVFIAYVQTMYNFCFFSFVDKPVDMVTVNELLWSHLFVAHVANSLLYFNKDGVELCCGLMQFSAKEELYEQLRGCDIIIYHIVDDAAEIDEAVWAVSRK